MNQHLLQKYRIFFSQAKQMRAEAGDMDNSPLQEQNIPKNLISLLPYAELWGISDDTFRIKLIEQSPPELWKDFVNVVSKHKLSLLDWLSGPEADNPPSREYLMFSFMLQAFDWPRDS